LELKDKLQALPLSTCTQTFKEFTEAKGLGLFPKEIKSPCKQKMASWTETVRLLQEMKGERAA